LKSRTREVDEKLLIEAAQKDPGRFGELYELNFERVYAFVARRVQDRAEAQDLTSEVFHKALANIGRFEWRDVPFGAWLLRIASNAVTEHLRRHAQRLSTEQGVIGAGNVESLSLEEIEKRARLFRLVRQLPPDQRSVITMRFAEEKSVREIACELGRTEGAVKQLQFRGLQSLRSRMNPRSPKGSRAAVQASPAGTTGKNDG
jgi:RNA polymerase sigma-70 factor, ECF subfamily